VKLSEKIEQLRADKRNFTRCWQGIVENIWEENAHRLGGLFNEEFIPTLELFVDVPRAELQRVWRKSSDTRVVAEYARKWPDDSDFALMQEAYLVSLLMRGRYHESIAKYTSSQLMHHPVRRSVLWAGSSLPPRTMMHDVPNTMFYMALILLLSAFGERRRTHRINLWAENLNRIRKAALIEDIDFAHKRSDDVAVRVVLREAKRLGLRAHPKWIEKGIDIGLVLGTGILTSFALSPFAGLAVGVATSLATERKKLGEAFASHTISSTHLSRLAHSLPGRVQEIWSGGD
jgi:hypothetical protein